jgi:hypothetical protein
MDRLIAACGLVCTECPGYKATQANDPVAAARVAAEWSAAFHVDVKVEHVWCDGCMTPSARKCHHCSECDVRACVVKRGLAHCAECPDYGCATIEAFMQMAPPARESLEALRAARA